MKKIISIFLALTMVSSLFCVNVFALTDDDYYFTITASKTEDIKANDVISVYVVLSTTDHVAGIQAYVKYDKDLFDGPYSYWDEDDEVTYYVGYADDFNKTFPNLTPGQRINNDGGQTVIDFDAASGTFGAQYARNGNAISTKNATPNLVVLGVKLTAKVDIPDGTTLWTNPGTCVIDRAVDGEANHTIYASPSLTFTTSASAATPAPGIIEETISENHITTETVAEKSFTSFSKLENIEAVTVTEFGIYFLATDDEISRDKVIDEGEAYKAEGKLADGSYSVKLINGSDEKDYFDKINIGFVSYMKIGEELIFGAFKQLK